jgi:hypothetical protein
LAKVGSRWADRIDFTPAIDRALAAFLHILTVSDHEDDRL